MTPVVESVIERRVLVNYRIEPERIKALLPPGLRPQLQRGWGVGGVCLLRLGELRLAGMPRALGLRSENAAHRFAVEWDDADGSHAGVYVPRRDTSSRLAARAGGLVFPGRYHRARFAVEDGRDGIRIEVSSHDHHVQLALDVRQRRELGGELFDSLEEALGFFRRGSLGWSPGGEGNLEGVRLVSERWEGQALVIEQTSSSLFDDNSRFPAGSCVLDSAIVMRDLPARWVAGALMRTGHHALAA